jgi:hypothetical protein
MMKPFLCTIQCVPIKRIKSKAFKKWCDGLVVSHVMVKGEVQLTWLFESQGWLSAGHCPFIGSSWEYLLGTQVSIRSSDMCIFSHIPSQADNS